MEDNVYGILGEAFAADIDAINKKRRVSRLRELAEARIMRDRVGKDAVITYNELTATYGNPQRLVDLYIWHTGLEIVVKNYDYGIVSVSMFKGNYEVNIRAVSKWKEEDIVMSGDVWNNLSILQGFHSSNVKL